MSHGIRPQKTLLVTGGAGFIGSCFILTCRAKNAASIVNLDLLTYSGNPENLLSLEQDPDYTFVRGDINDAALVRKILAEHQPDAIVNFAAETHVDRSILEPNAFARSNVLGVCTLLSETTAWWKSLPKEQGDAFRFLHVSTDEVFGALGPDDPEFTETTPYAPNSPYSASKAASDHFVRAFHATHGLPTLITNCSNNYGPRQFPEKLIPVTILNALSRKPLPVYGKGLNIRDWLYVEDHCRAISMVLEKGVPGQTYAIGGGAEKTNIEMVRTICAILDELRPHPDGPYAELITFVTDRPGHDFRYAINTEKIRRELGWKPTRGFEEGLRETVRWYLDNPQWLRNVQSGEYKRWMETNYGQRKTV